MTKTRSVAAVIAIVAGFILVFAVLLSPAKAGAPTAGGTDAHKWYVCKYVGTPGTDERLQTGQNPIFVDEHAIAEDPVVLGSYFNDKQGRSYVVAGPYKKKLSPEPDVSVCPPVTPPTTEPTSPPTTEPTSPPTTEPTSPPTTEPTSPPTTEPTTPPTTEPTTPPTTEPTSPPTTEPTSPPTTQAPPVKHNKPGPPNNFAPPVHKAPPALPNAGLSNETMGWAGLGLLFIAGGVVILATRPRRKSDA